MFVQTGQGGVPVTPVTLDNFSKPLDVGLTCAHDLVLRTLGQNIRHYLYKRTRFSILTKPSEFLDTHSMCFIMCGIFSSAWTSLDGMLNPVTGQNLKDFSRDSSINSTQSSPSSSGAGQVLVPLRKTWLPSGTSSCPDECEGNPHLSDKTCCSPCREPDKLVCPLGLDGS